MEEKLKMTFDLNTLEHLGVKLYTQYPAMIAELISNSWDADAENVKIRLFDQGEKKIEIEDDGEGMSLDELNECFLRIGRNRRLVTETKGKSSQKGRPILGKKGIGKLSMFGIADKITVETVKNKLKNIFEMSYTEMKSSGGEYFPNHLISNKMVEENNKTIIILENLKRKSSFDSIALSNNLSKRFNIFDSANVAIIHNNGEEVRVKNKEIFSDIKEQFKWEIPNFFEKTTDFEEIKSYLISKKITGTIFTSETPLKKIQQGVVLMARNKLVQENAFFDDTSNNYFHSYIYGVLNVDFIDEKDDDDNVSTDRKSLVWEGSELEELKENLNTILKIIEKEWRKNRKEKKQKEVEKLVGVNIEDWELTLNEYEKPLAKNLVDVIMKNDNIDIEESKKYFQHIKDVFSFESFKNYAQKLSGMELLENENVIKLLTDWELIEAKELAKIAEGRIQTIEKFAGFVETSASETKVIQPFFEKFPWILDARMNSFERELTLSKAIKNNIIDNEVAEYGEFNPLKRIDFFVTNFSREFTIYELKTPNVKITEAMLKSVVHYITYSSNFLASDLKKEGYKIKVVLITNNTALDPTVKYSMEQMIKSGDLIFKTYNELLFEARQYHRNFIEKYESIQKIKPAN